MDPKINACLELCGFVLLWFVPSIGLNLFNKWLFNHWLGGFTFPLTATMTHMFCNTMVAWACIRALKIEVPHIEWRNYCLFVVPIGVFTGLDISMTNLSFLLISVSLITVIKSASPFFILIFSFCLGLEHVRANLVAVVLIICAGAAMATTSAVETSGNVLLGSIFVLASSLAGGARWAITQVMLQQKTTNEKMSPLVALYFTAPVCAVCLVPIVVTKELPELFDSKFVSDGTTVLQTLGLLGCGVLMAFSLIIAEYAIISRFSAVTMTLAGVIKELLTIGLGIVLFGDRLSANTIVGAFVIIIGVLYYSHIKWEAQRTATDASASEMREGSAGAYDLVSSELVALDDQEYFLPEDEARSPVHKATKSMVAVGRGIMQSMQSQAVQQKPRQQLEQSDVTKSSFDDI